MPRPDYEIETLHTIRRYGSNLNYLSDDAIAELYREWSEQSYYAGWVDETVINIDAFIAWAITPPYLLTAEQYKEVPKGKTLNSILKHEDISNASRSQEK